MTNVEKQTIMQQGKEKSNKNVAKYTDELY